MPTVKKVVIPRSELIPVDGANQTLVRFRIISDDRNRFSEWSSIFSLANSNAITPSTANFASAPVGSIVMLAWQGIPSNTSLDIFISNDGEAPFYEGTTSENRYSFIISAQASYQFSVQRASIAKAYNESLQMFKSEVLNVV